MRSATFVSALLIAAGVLSPGAGAQQMGAKPVVTADPPAAQAALATSQTGNSPAQTGTVDPDYVIGPGDTLEINVFNEPKFSGTLPVRPDGMITVTLVGDITAAGLTPQKLALEVTARLKKLITDPNVTVTVLTINSKRIYLVGEVGKVGPLPMTPGMTPLQAIATAGGPGPYANVKHIYILRSVGNHQQKIPFNYKKAVKTGDMQGVLLLNGDTIVIP
jgi:polysaccharide biosynthesis/export protein